MADTVVMFSRHGLYWGNPPHPITWETIRFEMTQEQEELLKIKCRKQDVAQADLTVRAIQAGVTSLLSGEGIMPSDILDAQLGELELTASDEPKELTPTERRRKKYAKWGWSEEKLIHWLVNKHYPLGKFFTQEELEPYGICLLEGKGNDRRTE